MQFGKKKLRQKIKKAQSKKKKYISRLRCIIGKTAVAIFFIVMVTAAGLGLGMFKGIIDNAPEVDSIQSEPSKFATTIYDSAGNLVQTLVMSGSNREAAEFDEIPDNLIDAFVAIEDSRFWSHDGIDLRSIMRAAQGVLTGESKGGGSTLTQQLIKNNVFDGGAENTFGQKLERKIQEQYLALELEKESPLSKKETKKKIITDYLNTINLGNNALGVKVAARRYFDKELSELTLSECTVLAGIAKGPTKYNPVSGREANEERRSIILDYMNTQGFITKEEQEEALADDVYDRIQLVNISVIENTEPYSYFTDELIEQVTEVLTDEMDYTATQAHKLLYSGGLQIQTTQDPAIQAIVDEEINNPENYTAAKYSVEYRLSLQHADGTVEHYSEENIKNYHKETLGDSRYTGIYTSEDAVAADIDQFKQWLVKDGDQILGERSTTSLQPQASFVVIEQSTGQVKAVSGGRGEKKASLTLNRATNTLRQPGSTFKVLTAFAPALDACKSTLGTVYYDAPYSVGNKSFSNWYSTGFLGYSNIREGIIYSMNIVAVRCLMETVSSPLGIEYAQKMGITSLTEQDDGAAAVLGGLTKGVSNLELTTAFAAIANRGRYQKPIFFTKILDNDGNLIYNNESESHQVLKESTSFLLTDAMAESMRSQRKFAGAGTTVSATSARAALSGMSAAGKSGTTSSNKDIWFVGYTPYYTAGVWGGCDNNQPLLDKATGINNGGTSYHKDIWQKIMARIHENMTDPGFPVPADVETVQICRKSGKLAAEGVCDHDPRGNAVYLEYFAVGTAPEDVCDKHISVSVCNESGQKATASCPSVSARICMILPENETGLTDDSAYKVPLECSIHSGNPVSTEEETVSIAPITPITPASGGAVKPPDDILANPGNIFQGPDSN